MPAYAPADIHTLFREAYNLGDIDALTALYEPGATLVVEGKNVCGLENIGAFLEGIVQRHGRMTLETRTVIESKDGLAVLNGEWTIEPAEGIASGPTTRGLSTEVVRKQPDGTWLFVIDNPYTPGRS